MMFRSLKRWAPSVLGVFGSGLGLLNSLAILSINGDGSSDWQHFQSSVAWPILVGSLIGLAGGALYMVARRVGGTFLLAGGILVSPLTFWISIDAWQDPGLLLSLPGFLLSIFGFLVAPSILAGFLLFLGGLLSFHKTRRIIKTLHEGGWIP